MSHHASPIPLPDTSEPVATTRAPVRERWSWAVYDFANTIWSMNVASLYFTTWLVVDLGASDLVTLLATSISSVLMAISTPLLGAISDARRRRKPWVVGFTVASCVATALIGILGHSAVPQYGEGVSAGVARPETFHVAGLPLFWLALAFTVANFAYQAAQPFYNAMMTELVPPSEYGRMSGFGTAVGYAGTIVGVLLVAPFFNGAVPLVGTLGDGTIHALRLLPGTANGGRASTFVPTAVLFLAFSLPLFFFCRDHRPSRERVPVQWREAFAELARTIREAKKYPGTLRFIVTSLVYQDAVGTITLVLGLYAIRAVGFTQREVNLIFTILPVTAVIGSYLSGRVVDRIGAKRTLMIVLGAWVILLAAMALIPGKVAFWVIGALVGLIAFGGVPTAERPLLLSLVPDAEAGRFFSLLLLSSRAAAFVGPMIWGATVKVTEGPLGTVGAYHVAIGTVAGAFALAMLLLRGVPDRR